MKKPNETVEIFWSMFRWFAIIMLLTNGLWISAFYGIFGNSNSSITQEQSGANNHQEMTNG